MNNGVNCSLLTGSLFEEKNSEERKRKEFPARPKASSQATWIGEMALQLVTLTLKLSLKMPYFPDWGKLHFCYLQDRRFYQMEAHVFKNFFWRWDFTFPLRKGIQLPISARDWYVLVARFSKNRYEYYILYYIFRCFVSFFVRFFRPIFLFALFI